MVYTIRGYLHPPLLLGYRCCIPRKLPQNHHPKQHKVDWAKAIDLPRDPTESQNQGNDQQLRHFRRIRLVVEICRLHGSFHSPQCRVLYRDIQGTKSREHPSVYHLQMLSSGGWSEEKYPSYFLICSDSKLLESSVVANAWRMPRAILRANTRHGPSLMIERTVSFEFRRGSFEENRSNPRSRINSGFQCQTYQTISSSRQFHERPKPNG
mmetsp:Transcript_41546/g.58472  ORF Transcript_41546/g.58472 Transcript_41546/m.58472 type:complete len:210 (+) Transcript_41546:274-903(+)